MSGRKARPPSARPAAARAQRGDLDRARVVEAALELIDREGLAGFSLRRLAAGLGVYPTAVYWHLGRRNEILAAVVDRVLADVGKARAADSWEEALRRICFAYRAALQRHPNVAPLLGADLTSNLGVPLDFVEGVFAALRRGGFEGERLVEAYNVFVGALAGFVTLELSEPPAEERGAWTEMQRARGDALDPGAYPTLSALTADQRRAAFVLRWTGGRTQPLDSAFALFCEVLLSGIRYLERDLPG